MRQNEGVSTKKSNAKASRNEKRFKLQRHLFHPSKRSRQLLFVACGEFRNAQDTDLHQENPGLLPAHINDNRGQQNECRDAKTK